MTEYRDIIVIGAGPGGLAAAAAAKQNGADKVLLIERESTIGGILNQCIHDGFGLIRYNSQLSGPEYAVRAGQEAINSGVEIRTGLIVVSISPALEVQAIGTNGIEVFCAKAIVLATGCRERTRGAVMIPGSRPAGLFTAGVAQNLINTKNIMIGNKIVIIGSGDIGLIMARRLTLEGAKVLGVVELLPNPCGLARNISQCLYDYDIPLYLSYTVTNIIGKKRVTGIEIAKINAEKQIIPETKKIIKCDTVVFSIGLIPENEIALTAGVKLNPTNGIITDEYLQTNIPGIFSCGNCRTVMDLADFVSEQGSLAGKNAVLFARQETMEKWKQTTFSSMKKGLPEKNTITCIFCPQGCQITIHSNTIVGNKCERGKKYAMQEITDPQRILTTTIKVNCGDKPLAGIRSNQPISLSKLKIFMKKLKNKEIYAPIKSGDIVLSDIDGISFIAENSVSKVK